MKILYPLILFLIIVTLLYLLRVLLFKTGLIYVTKKWWRFVVDCFHVYQYFNVPEFNDGMQENQLYRKVYVYLHSLSSLEDSDYSNLFTGKKPNDIVLRLSPNQLIADNFLGARLSWINSHNNLVLKIKRSDKRRILRPYLQHIHTVSEEIEQKKKELKLYMNINSRPNQAALTCNIAEHNSRGGRWISVPFNHPATFETIAMESDLKAKIKADLETFLKSKQYYHRLGRVWKRSYLLYGPSGTGKSTFVAAMANFLNYDVYDIDLSKVIDDSDLNLLLLQTRPKSVVVIEDLDKLLKEKFVDVSLSGILNFMDGIVNTCCADEKVLVFTANNKDQIDPAVLRPGRIDVHIWFPLCDFAAFKTLANNYLGVKDHKLFPAVEEIFHGGASLSPAEISELMIAHRNSPTRALKTVMTALQTEGDGRGNIGRRLLGGSAAASRSSAEDGGEHSGIFCKESGVNAMKDIRKLYGLLRLKSNRKSHPSFDLSEGPKDG